MEPIVGEFQIARTGGLLSHFWMRVRDARPDRSGRSPRRCTMRSVLALLSPVIALYLMR